MITLYGIPNCNTVKKAMDWFKENNLEVDFHDFKKKGITVEKLEEWFGIFGWDRMINKNGLTFKKLDEKAQDAISSAEAAKTYLMANTSAIRRPVVEWGNGKYTIRFLEEEFEEALKG